MVEILGLEVVLAGRESKYCSVDDGSADEAVPWEGMEHLDRAADDSLL